MREKTLIELIEEIVKFGHLYHESQDESHVLMMQDRASILSERMGCNTVAAICFAFILTEAAWGRMPTRSDVMRFLPPKTSVTDRLQCLWELLDKKLIQMYKPAKNPIRHFYCSQEVAEKVVANRVPMARRLSLFPDENVRKVNIVACTGNGDYEIRLDGKSIGYILMSAAGDMFEVYWIGQLVHSGPELTEIVEWLNQAYDSGTLRSTQF